MGNAGHGQRFHDLDHFQGIARRCHQGLGHICEQRSCWAARAVGGLHQGPRQGLGRRAVGHDCTRANLHVEHQSFGRFSQFLGQDRRRDQVNAVHGARDIAHAVEQLVRRGEIIRSRDDGASNLGRDLLHPLERYFGSVARDCFKLVERAARMAQPAARDHQYIGAAGGQSRRQGQRHAIAHTAGGMFVEHGPGTSHCNVLPLSRMAHVQGDAPSAVEGRAADPHGKGAGLSIADLATPKGLRKPVQGLRAKLRASPQLRQDCAGI